MNPGVVKVNPGVVNPGANRGIESRLPGGWIRRAEWWIDEGSTSVLPRVKVEVLPRLSLHCPVVGIRISGDSSYDVLAPQ